METASQPHLLPHFLTTSKGFMQMSLVRLHSHSPQFATHMVARSLHGRVLLCTTLHPGSVAAHPLFCCTGGPCLHPPKFIPTDGQFRRFWSPIPDTEQSGLTCADIHPPPRAHRRMWEAASLGQVEHYVSCRRTVPHCPPKGAYRFFLSSIVLITDLQRRHEGSGC